MPFARRSRRRVKHVRIVVHLMSGMMSGMRRIHFAEKLMIGRRMIVGGPIPGLARCSRCGVGQVGVMLLRIGQRIVIVRNHFEVRARRLFVVGEFNVCLRNIIGSSLDLPAMSS